jgi:hypothetical protein
MAKPKIYLWFSNYRSGDHCNTISLSPSDIATEIVDCILPNADTELEGCEDKTKAETKFHILREINKLEAGDNCYFGLLNETWMTITLLDDRSLNNVKKILAKANTKSSVTKSKKKS